MGVYSLNELRIDGFPSGSILEMKVVNQLGNHTELHLKVEIQPQQERWILFEMGSYHRIGIYGNGEVVFKGLIEQVQIENTTEFNCANIIAKSCSILMDIEKKSRTFQDINESYESVINKILSSYSNADYNMCIPDQPIGKLLIQYLETDWEFLNRILSELYLSIANVADSYIIRLYLGGIQQHQSAQVSLMRMSKNENQYLTALGYGLDVIEDDFIDYEIKANQCIHLFHSIHYKQKKVVIYKSCFELKRGMLECCYLVRHLAGIFTLPIYPVSLVGVSLEAKILEVKGNLVRAHLKIDDRYQVNDVYWFPYATLSASPDGSGWYYMPEISDCVRVHFPTKYPENAIVISSISRYEIPGQGDDSMGNSSTKYLSNQGGQKMMLSEDGIHIVTRSGASSVTINNDGTIYIHADKIISIKAGESIGMKATEIKLCVSENMEISSEEGGTVCLKNDGNLELKGSEVFVN